MLHWLYTYYCDAIRDPLVCLFVCLFFAEPYFFSLQVKTEQASQFCERVATRRTVKSLETEIIQKTKRIQTEERKYELHFACLVFISFLFHVLVLAPFHIANSALKLSFFSR